MTPKRDSELSAFSGAYSLDALAEPEKTEFEALVNESDALRSEVTELTDTAVELGLSVTPETPSAEFRANLLALIAQTPQFAPDETVEHEVAPSRVPVAVPVTASATTSAVEAGDVDAKPAGPAEARAQRRWLQRPIGTLVSAAAAVALIVGVGFGANTVLQAQGDMATAAQINEIQAADDYQRQVVDLDGGGSATLVWSGALERSALIVDGMKGLPAGSTYELWYIDGAGDATPAGTFDVGDDGKHSVVLAGQMSAGDSVGVTVEPAGGSDSPSGDTVVYVPTA